MSLEQQRPPLWEVMYESFWRCPIAAAALRAAAVNGDIKTRGGGVIFDCRSLLAIAAELET